MSLRKQATSGMLWTFSQQFGNQIIGFLVSLVLARVLLPEEFGLIGMIAVFSAIGTTLMNSGLTRSLIRSEEIDQEDYSTVFFFNLAASILIYILIFLAAPLIADFYNQPILKEIVRLYCTTFVITSFAAVQQARLTKQMDFKIQTIISIPSTLLGGVVGVAMAYLDFGVWSLVWSQIIATLARTIQLWFYTGWKPSWCFNKIKFKEHFNFGYKLTLSSLLETIFKNAYLIIIGKFFMASQVGYYTRAETMKQLPVTNISNALNKVTYPLFASIQDDDLRLKRVYKQVMQMVIFVIAPVLILLAVLAEPTFRFLFTEKWLPAVPYFQILCVVGILYPINAYNLNVLNVKGRSDLYLKLEIIKKVLIVIVIAVAIKFGILGLLYGQVLLGLVAFVINSYYTGKFINYTAWDQTKDIFPFIIMALTGGLGTYLLDNYFTQNLIDIIRILSGGILGAGIYLLLSFIFKNEFLKHLKNIALNR